MDGFVRRTQNLMICAIQAAAHCKIFLHITHNERIKHAFRWVCPGADLTKDTYSIGHFARIDEKCCRGCGKEKVAREYRTSELVEEVFGVKGI